MAHGMNARTMPGRGAMAKGKKEMDHMRVMKAENGGHMVEHHFQGFDHPPEQGFAGSAPTEEVALPKGHVLQHIAEHMGIPHSVVEAKAESADKTDAKAGAPDEEEELEEA